MKYFQKNILFNSKISIKKLSFLKSSENINSLNVNDNILKIFEFKIIFLVFFIIFFEILTTYEFIKVRI